MATIARKELARFFSNKVAAAVAILLPGLLIFGMWSFMGDAMSDMMAPSKEKQPAVAVVNQPASMDALAASAGIELANEAVLPDAYDMRTRIEQGDVKAFAVFPEGFDQAVDSYGPASGAQAPQVEIYYNSSDPDSLQAFSKLAAALDAYESSLSNRFDVNAAPASYDVADERDTAGSFVVTIVPLMLLIFLFTSCMSIAAESVAGEKERGTMATMLATPIRRRDIALGKILAVSLIGLLSAASSMIGIFAGLGNLTKGQVNVGVYGVQDYVLLAVVAASTALVLVMLIVMVSTFAKSTKEATTYLTPLMIVVMLVGVLGMFGNGPQSDWPYYLIPLYNSVQCMIGIFTFDFQPLNAAVCVASNLACTGAGIAVLQRMFDSERLMFAR